MVTTGEVTMSLDYLMEVSCLEVSVGPSAIVLEPRLDGARAPDAKGKSIQGRLYGRGPHAS